MSKKKILFVGEASFLSTGFSTYYRELLPRLAATGKFEIAELGSYSNAHHPEIQNFIKGRWKFYAGLPSSPEENVEFQKLCSSPHPRDKGGNISQFGAWNFDKTMVDFQPDMVIDVRDAWMCLKSGTNIITKIGNKNIEDVQIGDEVLTHAGHFKKVTRTFQQEYSGSIFSLRASNIGIPIEITENHPVLVVKRKRSDGGYVYMNLPDFSVAQPEWINSQDVNLYDFVCFPIPKYQSNLNIPFDLARLIGYYAAEGCLLYEGRKEFGSIKGIQLCFAEHETVYIEECRLAIKNHFNVDAKIHHYNDAGGNRIIVRAFGANIGEYMNKFVPGLAGTKNIHSDLVFSCKEIVTSFLCGLFRGDGCYNINTGRCSYCTKSPHMAFQVFMMCLRLGMAPTFNKNQNKISGRDKTYYRYIFGFAGKSKEICQKVYSGIVPNEVDNKRMNNDYLFCTIKNISNQKEKTQVYNFEVEDDHSYVSSFALHNCTWQLRSPFRSFVKMLLMPTVDSPYQDELWIDDYEKCNLVMAYSDFGIHTLKSQSSKIKLFPKPMRPGVDLETFKPLDKHAIREKFNLSKDIMVLGVVKRNQGRKNILDIIDAFAMLKNKYDDDSKVKKAVLLLHTSWPDNMYSFDYPRHIKRLQSDKWTKNHRPGIMYDILQVLQCHNCGQASVCFAVNLYGKPVQTVQVNGRQIQGVLMPCCYCGKQTATCPATGTGVTREQLAEIYNLMDVLVQCSIAEGCNMPTQEAKACGVPAIVTNHSATIEKGRFPEEFCHFKELGITAENYTVNKGGIVHEIAAYRHEPETGCLRAVPDVYDVVEKMHLLITDDDLRLKMSKEARECAEENYDWNKLAKQWEYVLDNVKPLDRSKTWDSPIEIQEDIKPIQIPDGLTDAQYVEWLYLNILKYPKVDDVGAQQWLQNLQSGVTRQQLMAKFVEIGNSQMTESKARDKLRSRLLKKDNKRVQELI